MVTSPSNPPALHRSISDQIIYVYDDTGSDDDLEDPLEPDELPGLIEDPVRIGAREFSENYKAPWTAPTGQSQVVVIKCLRWIPILLLTIKNERASTEEAARIREDLKRWCSLRHANIVEFLGFRLNARKGEPSIIAPYYPNGNIQVYLKKKPYTDVTPLFSDIASGLHYLHSLKPPIAHGALRPANVLISSTTSAQGRPRAMVSDYGHAEYIATARYGLTTGNEDAKFIGYSAPEFIENGSFTPESDVYALGGLILHILSGLPPQHKLHYVAVMRALTNGTMPDPADHLELSKDSPFWPVMRACWTNKPASRPSAEAIAEMISKVGPISLKPQPSTVRYLYSELCAFVSDYITVR